VKIVAVAWRICAVGGLGAILMTSAWGQGTGRVSAEQFRVTWERRAFGVRPSIEGHVYNTSSVRVTDVRLQIEGLGADSRPVGRKFAWALGDIVPGGETSFVTPAMPGAVDYQITVISYDVVSSQAP